MLPVQTTKIEVMARGASLAAAPLREEIARRRRPPPLPAQQPRGAVREVDHGGRRAGRAGSSSQRYDLDRVAEGPPQSVAGRRGRLAAAIRARHRERAGRLEDRPRQRMRGLPDPDRRGFAAEVPLARCEAARGNTMVSAPGQKAEASRSARSSNAATSPALATDGTRTGSASSRPRRLARKTRAVASPVVGACREAVHRVGREDDESAVEHRPDRLGDRIRVHGHAATTTRSRPFRSGRTSTWRAPASRASPRTSSPRSSPISTTVNAARTRAAPTPARTGRHRRAVRPTSASHGSARTSAGRVA